MARPRDRHKDRRESKGRREHVDKYANRRQNIAEGSSDPTIGAPRSRRRRRRRE